MSEKRILCNLNDPGEMKLWIKMAEATLTSSSYNTVSGAPTSIYYDVDKFILGKKTEDDIYDVKENALNVKQVANRFVDRFNLVEKECAVKIDKIAFIDKGGGGGPVGMISFLAFAAANVGKAILIVRPWKRLINAAIKGKLRKDENVLIVSDVATAGTTIYRAAQKIWQLGGKVPCALVWMDRKLGASENLEQYGIKLYSIVTPKVLASKSKKIRKTFREVRQEKSFIDFGGSSITLVSSSFR